MIKPISGCEETSRYFQTLPQSVQENITQSGMTFDTVDDLRACAAKLLGAR